VNAALKQAKGYVFVRIEVKYQGGDSIRMVLKSMAYSIVHRGSLRSGSSVLIMSSRVLFCRTIRSSSFRRYYCTGISMGLLVRSGEVTVIIGALCTGKGTLGVFPWVGIPLRLGTHFMTGWFNELGLEHSYFFRRPSCRSRCMVNSGSIGGGRPSGTLCQISRLSIGGGMSRATLRGGLINASYWRSLCK